jgi:peptide/nickel transport system substrate-binding protein
MGRFAASFLLLALALVPSGCRQQPEGSVKVVVIGSEPRLRDPALGPLSPPDEIALSNAAQGLVRFDPVGNIVAGLAERWNVSDDGLSYIFRLASCQWPDGKKVTAEQVAKLLKRQLASRSKNSLKDSLGAISDIVAMTDRVIEIRLAAPRPNLLSLLAQPQLAVLRNGQGTGPYKAVPAGGGAGLRLTREITSLDDESTSEEEVLLDGAAAGDAIAQFAAAKSDLVLGGSFDDLPDARKVKLPRGSLRFDPASGLFGLVPARADGPFANAKARALLSQAIDRDALINAFDVPGLAARATLLEPGLDGVPPPVQPAWTATPLDQRRETLAASAARLFTGESSKTIKLLLPEGAGGEILFDRLAADWSALGLTVERATGARSADFRLIDLVAPSSSPAWFIRQFRCGMVALCDDEADTLLDAARVATVPAQRYALLAQAAGRIDDAQLFIPLTAPIRWSLVSGRVQNFAGNRFARHTLTGLQDKPGTGD